MNTVFSSLRERKNWVRLVLSAVIFFAVALPFRQLLNLMPGITEIRPANVIPPVLGLVWGPFAAAGIAIGNLISDIVSGSNEMCIRDRANIVAINEEIEEFCQRNGIDAKKQYYILLQ